MPIRSTMAVAFAVVGVALAASMSARQQTTQPPQTVPPVIAPVGPTIPTVPGTISQTPRQTGFSTLGPITAIVGQVVDTTGRPVPLAAVRLITDRVLETVLTDPRGRFAFSQIPSGEMIVTAQKDGYFDGGYGQRRPTGLPLPFSLPYTQTMPNMKIEVYRGATITGAVQDEAGEPIVGAHVFAARRQFTLGEWQYVGVDSEDTDDQGQFRIFGLMPGDYTVTVAQMPVAPRPQGEPQTQDRDKPMVFPRMYYPQAPDKILALPVTLAAGDVRYGVNFTLPAVVKRRVVGQLLGPSAAVAAQIVKLVPMDASWLTDEAGSTISESDGTFVFDEVPAGQYRVQAGNVAPLYSFAATGDSLANSVDADRPYCGTAEVIVHDANVVVPGIEMVLSAAVAGRIDIERLAGSGVQIAPPRRVPISIEPGGPGLSRSIQVSVSPGTPFAVSHLIPGRYFVRAGSLPAGWSLRSIDVAGQDALDSPIDLKEADAIVTIKLADRGTEVIGSVWDNRRQFASGAAVIILPAGIPREAWSPNRVRQTRTSTSGVFTIRGLPPGEYSIIIVDDGSAEGWQDERVLARLMPLASRFVLHDMETLSLALQMR